MISNYMIPLEKIAAIASGLVYSENMILFAIGGECNIRKIFLKIFNKKFK